MLNILQMMVGNSIAAVWAPLILSTIILGVQTAACFVVYCILKNFLDKGAASSFSETLLLCFLLFVLLGAYYVLVRTFVRRSASGGYSIVAELRTRVCDHLRSLPLSFFRKNDPSVLSSILLRNMSDAEAFFSVYLYEMASCVIVPAGLGLIMVFMDWRIAAAIFATLLITVPIVMATNRAAVKDTPAYADAVARVDAAMLEYFGGIGELKGAGRTGAAFTPFTRSNEHFIRTALALEAKNGVFGQLFLATIELVFVAAVIVGTLLIVDGNLHLGVFLFFLLVTYRLIDPLQNLGCFWLVFKFCLESMKRIGLVLQEKALPVQAKGPTPSDNGIEFSDVSFAYAEKEVLSGISFSIPEGGLTALVGESGGGKTTISNLLLRFWDVKSGAIRIGGTDIRTFSPEDLYARFSAVFQDVYLFNDTVMNNIRMARPGATDEEVLNASRLACCHEFIMNLENGYDTTVGERGSRLSGGERQRIAIARAILKNAPILILDEATASVDPENELQIQQGLTNLTKGKTLLVIAHRLATIRDADEILVLRDGRIAERGTHDELIEAKGAYKRLWDSQERLKGWKLKQCRE